MQRLDITNLFPEIYAAIRGLEKATGDLKLHLYKKS